MSHLIRQKRHIHEFVNSDEIPPAGEEDYILWQYKAMILTEQQAIEKIADLRRYAAHFKPIEVDFGWGNTIPVLEPTTVEAVGKPLPRKIKHPAEQDE